MYVYVIYVCIFIHVYIYPYIHMCMCVFVSFRNIKVAFTICLKAVVTEFHRLSALNNKPFISHSSGGVEVQDLVASRLSSKWGLPSRFADRHLLAVFSHGEEQREKGSPCLFCKDTDTIWGSHLHNLITPKAPPPNTITLEISIPTDWFWWTRSSVFGCCVCVCVCVQLCPTVHHTHKHIYLSNSKLSFFSEFVCTFCGCS